MWADLPAMWSNGPKWEVSLKGVPLNRMGKTKNVEPQNRPNTVMKSPGEPTTLLILYHQTQNGTTVLDSRFQHSTG